MLAEVRETGIRVGVLSNAPVALARAARQSDWAHLVQEWFFSGELGVAKPDPAIYQLVARQLDVPEAKTYFFDDRHANVAAARDAGWNAFLWSTVAAARADLEELGVL